MQGACLDEGIEIRDETLERLWPVLRNWQTNIHDEIRAFDDDVPCPYNERASLSVLCGAAWRSGYLALKEYVAIKGDGSGKPNGRIDLYIGQREDDEEICIEANHQVLPADCKDAAIENPIANAKADARRLRAK
jgi:hypothetical protein